jgi:hypothetical protein
MMIDMQTAVCAINFDSRRQLKLLPDSVIFEHRELDGTYTTLGSLSSGWCVDEVAGETFGGSVVEYQLLIATDGSIDYVVQRCSSVKIAETRYEKRAVDPRVGSPAVIRMRVQPITGYQSF